MSYNKVVPTVLVLLLAYSFHAIADSNPSNVDLSACKSREDDRSDLRSNVERDGFFSSGKVPEACKSAIKEAEQGCYGEAEAAERDSDEFARSAHHSGDPNEAPKGALEVLQAHKASFKRGSERFKKGAEACRKHKDSAIAACMNEHGRLGNEIGQHLDEEKSLKAQIQGKAQELQNAQRQQAPNSQSLSTELDDLNKKAIELRKTINEKMTDRKAVGEARASADRGFGNVSKCQDAESKAFEEIMAQDDQRIAMIAANNQPDLMPTGGTMTPPNPSNASGGWLPSSEALGDKVKTVAAEEAAKHAVSAATKQVGQYTVTELAKQAGSTIAETAGATAGRYVFGPAGVLLSSATPTALCGDEIIYNPVSSINKGCGGVISYPMAAQAAAILGQK